MNLAQKALQELFPEKSDARVFSVEYSGRFSAYNANVKYGPGFVRFSLSREWETVSEEIQQGVVEHLLCKIYRTKRSSSNQDLYRSFMKHLSKYARIDEKDPYLFSRFEVINERYFNGMMSAPNLRFGKRAFRKLGHYEYSSDTIVISSIFEKAPFDPKVEELLDFVLYHEMLHKVHQYDHKKQRAVHHSRAFRDDEKKWHDKDVEKKLSWFLSKRRLKKAFFGAW